jgi:hypothetical protein
MSEHVTFLSASDSVSCMFKAQGLFQVHRTLLLYNLHHNPLFADEKTESKMNNNGSMIPH